jgi:hypothetical protein
MGITSQAVARKGIGNCQAEQAEPGGDENNVGHGESP